MRARTVSSLPLKTLRAALRQGALLAPYPIIRFGQLSDKQAAEYRGHGEVNIVSESTPVSGRYNKRNRNVEACTRAHTPKSAQGSRLNAYVLSPYGMLANTRSTPIAAHPANSKSYDKNLPIVLGIFARNTDVNNQTEIETLELFATHGKSPIYLRLKLTKSADDYRKWSTNAKEDRLALPKVKQRQSSLGKDPTSSYPKELKDPGRSHWQRCEKPKDDPEGGGEKGPYATNEREIDAIAREAWSEVYEGNASDVQEVAQNFLAKCHDHVYRSPDLPVDPIERENLKDARNKNAEAAGGLDGWNKKGFRWLPDSCFDWLSLWVNKIEQIGQWPEAQLKARAVFLREDIFDAGRPASYRIVKINIALYRLWASVRMRQLEGWVGKWADGWYLAAVDVEFMRTASTRISAGSVDICKWLRPDS
jgi:hypothetical protein